MQRMNALSPSLPESFPLKTERTLCSCRYERKVGDFSHPFYNKFKFFYLAFFWRIRRIYRIIVSEFILSICLEFSKIIEYS